MKEHRVIERMIRLVKKKLVQFGETRNPDTGFITDAVDFLTVYADICHHGKEERILFASLNGKNISVNHKKIMERLIEDHRFGRKAVSELRLATARFAAGERDALGIILGRMKDLADLYPPHIKLEDEAFFLQVMKYFDKSEQQKMLEEFFDFDSTMTHEIYKGMVTRLEAKINGSQHRGAPNSTNA